MFEPQTRFTASETRDTLGMTVDTADVEGALSSARIDEADIAAGDYDRAIVETLMVNWRQPADFTLLRRATIGRITRVDGRFMAELESAAHELDKPSGRYVARTCDAELGETRCGFTFAASGFSGAGAVTSHDGPGRLRVSGLDAFGVGWFSQGTLTWVTGIKAGRSERIEEHRKAGSSIQLMLRPGPGVEAQVGDAFTVKAGCDKKFATCRAKFGNALNFRGFPHLPGNDKAYAYVVDGDDFDGGPVVP